MSCKIDGVSSRVEGTSRRSCRWRPASVKRSVTSGTLTSVSSNMSFPFSTVKLRRLLPQQRRHLPARAAACKQNSGPRTAVLCARFGQRRRESRLRSGQVAGGRAAGARPKASAPRLQQEDVRVRRWFCGRLRRHGAHRTATPTACLHKPEENSPRRRGPPTRCAKATGSSLR